MLSIHSFEQLASIAIDPWQLASIAIDPHHFQLATNAIDSHHFEEYLFF